VRPRRKQFVAPIAALALAWLMVPAAGAQARPKDFFYAQGKQVALKVRPDRLGVLVGEGTTAAEARTRMRALGLRRLHTYDGGVVIGSLPRALRRPALQARATATAKQLGDDAAQVGIVALPRGGRVPLVVTPQVVVHFDEDATPEQSMQALDSVGGRVVTQNPFVPAEFLITVRGDWLAAANRLHRADGVMYSLPDLGIPVDFRQAPNDPLFGDQWHHENDGATGFTEDADIDTLRAWDFTRGSPDTVIAIIDRGIEETHPDLVGNLWDSGDAASDGIDGPPANGYVDDVHGWNFKPCDTASSSSPCGTPVFNANAHGTAVAGLAAASADNETGGSGVCPGCRLMVVEIGATTFYHAVAIEYAAQNGADVINSSWGYPLNTPVPANVQFAIDVNAGNARNGLGAVTVFAMPDSKRDACITPDLAGLPKVIGVSAITDRDTSGGRGFGSCMDVLAPASGNRRTLSLTTTDLTGSDGLNDGTSDCPGGEYSGAFPPNLLDYTKCFSGNSGAAAIVSGIAGLVLSVDPTLSRQRVQEIIQDTAAKADDAGAAYGSADGFSQSQFPYSSSAPSTHGYGRVNAFEAVRLAAPVADGGRAEGDLFGRDDVLDWGNTEQPSNIVLNTQRSSTRFWESEYIAIEDLQDGYLQSPPQNAQDFVQFVSDDAGSGHMNNVYVLVANRSRNPLDGRVALYEAFAGSALPPLQAGFWSQFPGPTPGPFHLIGDRPIPTDVQYSGSTAAHGGAMNGAKVVMFPFTAPAPGTGAEPYHFCLLAIIYSPEDPVSPTSMFLGSPDQITPIDNNVIQRNIRVYPVVMKTRERLSVRNPTASATRARLTVTKPRRWKVKLDGFDFKKSFTLDPSQDTPTHVTITPPRRHRPRRGVVIITQRTVDPATGAVITGGMTYRFNPKRPAPPRRR
jgi:hypothetical protein